MGRGGSDGAASDRKAGSNTDAGSIPCCGKGFYSQNQLSVQTLLQCLYSACVQLHAYH